MAYIDQWKEITMETGELCSCGLREREPNSEYCGYCGVFGPQAASEVEDRPVSRIRDAPGTPVVRAIVIGVFIVGLASFAFIVLRGAWNEIDLQGWIDHSRETPVWIGGNWINGESRLCRVIAAPAQNPSDPDHMLCPQGAGERAEEIPGTIVVLMPGEFLDSLTGDELRPLLDGDWQAVNHRFHVLPVTYSGRIDRQDRNVSNWRCVREEALFNRAVSLVCKAVD